ncbi:hypothetical protein [Cystobacter ferrugineus]|nr:hypothetical protein [Cystobacter ferrugineus]
MIALNLAAATSLRVVALLLALSYVLTGCGGERGPEWIRAGSGTTHTLEAIHGNGPQDVWAVGQAGTILHFDGSHWSPVDSGTDENLKAVWAQGPKDVWAVGERVTLHWDGAQWTRAADSGGTSVWASGPEDVWVAGGNLGGVLHFNGKEWTSSPLPTGHGSEADVWGNGPGNVWVCQLDQGNLAHWNGTSFKAELPRLPTSSRCRDLGGSDPVDAWALYHVDPYDYPSEQKMVVLHKGGGEDWRQLSLLDAAHREDTSRWTALWGTTGKVWVVGSGGLVDHFDGQVWNREQHWDDAALELHDVWGSSEKDVWVVGENGLVARRALSTSH